MEATKRATRDYPSFSKSPWKLWDVIYARRSSRKFLPLQVGNQFVSSLNEVARLAASTRGADPESIMVVWEEDRVDKIRKKTTKGRHGKINLWLLRTPLSGFLVLALPRRDVQSERPEMLPHTAMAAEDCVLWLTEAGLGTCWLGGLNKREIKRILGLGDEVDVPAIIPFGKPKPRIRARDLDNLLYRRISRHRRPLTRIAFQEIMEHPYVLKDMAALSFSASSTQEINGLLHKLAGGKPGDGDVPLDLALEACLEAARVAPNAGNAQNWRFILVTGEKELSELVKACGAPHAWKAAIVGASVPGRMEEYLEKPFWMLDVPIAFSHMSLMAASMDLAVDLYVSGFDENAVNGIAGLSSPVRTVGVMGIR